MFSIKQISPGEVVVTGWLDSSHTDDAAAILDALTESTRVDMKDLEYISSAGLGLLLKTQKRLKGAGHTLTLFNMKKMVRDVFRLARFDLVMKIED
jgi:anti-sigma B factor antagonist